MPKPEIRYGKYLYCIIHTPPRAPSGNRDYPAGIVPTLIRGTGTTPPPPAPVLFGGAGTGTTSETLQMTNLGIGERGDKIHTIDHMGISAVVSDTPIQEYEESRRNMMAHTLVLEEVMRQCTILPVRFGTVAPSVDAVLEQVLKRRYGGLISSFEEVENRIELGVKAFWYEGVIFQEIIEQNASIRSLRDSLKNHQAEQTFYERIRLGELIEAAMEKKRDEDSEKILEKLRPLVYKTRANKVITDKMILNAAFLLDRQREPEFDQVIRKLDAEMQKRVMFKYVGPVPPYNFVNLVIHWDE
ncbi:MAG: GvpL/GvpF family gas vesicle protein [Chloroflexi bacterium]|nr:GvpL/GvpF family gas vesicle protein [Chloroflexota bacterium]